MIFVDNISIGSHQVRLNSVIVCEFKYLFHQRYCFQNSCLIYYTHVRLNIYCIAEVSVSVKFQLISAMFTSKIVRLKDTIMYSEEIWQYLKKLSNFEIFFKFTLKNSKLSAEVQKHQVQLIRFLVITNIIGDTQISISSTVYGIFSSFCLQNF